LNLYERFNYFIPQNFEKGFKNGSGSVIVLFR